MKQYLICVHTGLAGFGLMFTDILLKIPKFYGNQWGLNYFSVNHLKLLFCKIIIVRLAYGYCIMLLLVRWHHSSEGGGKPGRPYSDREKLLISFTVEICYQSLNQLSSSPLQALLNINLLKYKITHLFLKVRWSTCHLLIFNFYFNYFNFNFPAKITQST